MKEYSNSIELLVEKDLDLLIDSFKINLQYTLKTLECRTEMQEDCITFHRIVRYLPLSNPGKNEILKLLREGSIGIRKIGPDKIEIKWTVKLETLMFISACTGFIAGLGIGFINSSIPAFITAGVFFYFIAYFVGYIIIRIQIDDIVFTSMNQSQSIDT